MSGKNDSSEKYAREAARLVQPWRRKSDAAPRISRKMASIWAARLATQRQKIKANPYRALSSSRSFRADTTPSLGSRAVRTDPAAQTSAYFNGETSLVFGDGPGMLHARLVEFRHDCVTDPVGVSSSAECTARRTACRPGRATRRRQDDRRSTGAPQ